MSRWPCRDKCSGDAGFQPQFLLNSPHCLCMIKLSRLGKKIPGLSPPLPVHYFHLRVSKPKQGCLHVRCTFCHYVETSFPPAHLLRMWNLLASCHSSCLKGFGSIAANKTIWSSRWNGNEQFHIEELVEETKGLILLSFQPAKGPSSRKYLSMCLFLLLCLTAPKHGVKTLLSSCCKLNIWKDCPG